MQFNLYSQWGDVSPLLHRLYRGEADHFFISPSWIGNFIETCLDPEDELFFLSVERDCGSPLCILPGVKRATPQRLRWGKEVASLTNYYSTWFAPLIAADITPETACSLLVESLLVHGRRADLIDINTLEGDTPLFRQLQRNLARAGFVTRPYFHFGNWFEVVDGLSFEDFMARRPGRLRSTVRRKRNRLSRSGGDATFRIYQAPGEATEAINQYETVYAASWKPPEPHPKFMPGVIHRAAEAGVLRLGVCFAGSRPVAAQVWITHRRRATIFKLAHDERFKDLSAGTLLTAHMVRHALEIDRVAEIDFGRGDDAYKRDWLSGRRERQGIAAYNPRRPVGWALGKVQELKALRG